ncbi:alginate export family protein [Dongia soli]|uniref:Alginate export family protein n=1 Tax=Dongia soli TaxID=600628 RepID=A0ABU5E7D3_9PROT|nr:alginate export family protein [Dongia soli]MDY0881540.1 alginate export family protein [Dongia soli]
MTKNSLPSFVFVGIAASLLPVMANADGFEPPAYKTLRFEEDYRYLQDESRHTDFWDPIKYIPLSDSHDFYLTLGGELRERFEYYSAPDFSLDGEHSDAYLFHRLLLHADLHLGEFLRGFVQFGSALEAWKDSPLGPTDANHLDLQQGFLDAKLPIAEDSDIDPTLRFGRQEILYGTQRLVSVREPPNVRRSFDGFRLDDNIGGVKLSALAVRPVNLREDIFDDDTNSHQALWGTYNTIPVPAIPGLNLDLYYLGFHNNQASFGDIPGDETRHSLGTRIFGETSGFDWNWEFVGQFGSFHNEDIRAWTAASDTGYTFENVRWQPRLGVKANIASGDTDAKDHKLGTFNPLFPRLGYFSEASLIAPSNFFDVQPSVTIQPFDNVSVSLSWDALWRTTTNDAIYIEPNSAVDGTAGHGGHYTGNQVALDVDWQFDRHIEVKASYVHFDAGSALKSAGGKDVDFVMFSTAYKF